jgi:hypothetical protein
VVPGTFLKEIMKKVFTDIVFLAAAGAAFGTGSWAASDRVVYDGESEIIFDYSGPEWVLARVYQDGTAPYPGGFGAGLDKSSVNGRLFTSKGVIFTTKGRPPHFKGETPH